MLKFVVLTALIPSLTWFDYAVSNAHTTTLEINMPEARIACQFPNSGPQGKFSKCVGKTETKTLYLLCPAYEYGYCKVLVRNTVEN